MLLYSEVPLLKDFGANSLLQTSWPSDKMFFLLFFIQIGCPFVLMYSFRLSFLLVQNFSSSHLFKYNLPTIQFWMLCTILCHYSLYLYSLLTIFCIATTAIYNVSIILNNSYCSHVDTGNLILNCINFFNELTIW